MNEFNNAAYESYLNSLEISTRRAAESVIGNYKEFCEDADPPLDIHLVRSVGLYADHLHSGQLQFHAHCEFTCKTNVEEELLTSAIWKKVCLIVGVHGLLRLNEIHQLHWSRVEKKEDMFLITIFR